MNEARKSSDSGRLVTSCSYFKKYPDTKSEEFYLKDESVKVEKRNERPHLAVVEAMVGGWGDGSGAVSLTSALTTGHPLS